MVVRGWRGKRAVAIGSSSRTRLEETMGTSPHPNTHAPPSRASGSFWIQCRRLVWGRVRWGIWHGQWRRAAPSPVLATAWSLGSNRL